MKNILITIFVIIVLAVNTNANAFGVININVKVIDESGKQLKDAKLRVRFSGGEMPVIRNTDDKGNCSITSSSNDGVVVGTAIKDGYYDSTFHHDFYAQKLGVWQPWGKKLTVVMRPIVNPVPMYVRNASFNVPVTEEEVGFDLEKADWVIPYGQGTHSDFIFNVERRFDNVDNFDAKMTLTFSNAHDGIQVFKDDGGGDFNVGSWFRLSRMAPESGYQSNLERRRSRGSYGRYDDKNEAEDNNFIFRVRSEVDETGNLKRAMYGKIRGDIRFSTGVLKVGMHYYLNSDYTSNLEFDPKRNLFVITDPGENVTAP
ncbi:hypothetical protein [Trichloromonas sp.]|uniref:hypothetical protein n=1 Tax=Trichloromonas sp. TaxID=3069249 RepID=UPI003D818CC1